MTLIGWGQPVESHDGGVPADVARVLARALTSVARVTFPSSSVHAVATSAWSPLDGDLTRAIAGKGVAGRVVAKLRGAPTDVALLSTLRPETAMRLFDDAGFPWWLQGQVALLSEREAPPPDIDHDTVLALLADEWTKHAASLGPVGVVAVLRPGVDGDVAGLLSLTDAFDRSVLAALERETQLAGFDWALAPESVFPLG